MMKRIKSATMIVLTLASASLAMTASAAAPAAAAANDDAMMALATHSGCLTCHSIQPVSSSDPGPKPVGPAWTEVAAKYKDQKDAAQKLTDTVMQGSNPYASHWKGKVTGLAMPPNAVAITRDEARQLVRWILSLDVRKT
jgi:cytochrome c